MESHELQIITLPNGKQAVVIVPELVEELAVVDLKVIKRLASLLPSANLGQIKRDLITRINESATTLEEYVVILKDEVSFHESVNMINSIGRVDLRPTEMAVPAREYNH